MPTSGTSNPIAPRLNAFQAHRLRGLDREASVSKGSPVIGQPTERAALELRGQNWLIGFVALRFDLSAGQGDVEAAERVADQKRIPHDFLAEVARHYDLVARFGIDVHFPASARLALGVGGKARYFRGCARLDFHRYGGYQAFGEIWLGLVYKDR